MTKDTVKAKAKKYGCRIVAKGKTDYVASRDEFKINTTGNVGMTKGGTGDVLAGLIAGFAATNDLFLAASAGVFINGLAGDRLKKKVSRYYNASDLVNEIPKTIKWCEDF
jgi:NAD(P)H-hydrate epimerase